MLQSPTNFAGSGVGAVGTGGGVLEVRLKVDNQEYLKKDNATMEGDLNMNEKKIVNLPPPSENKDG